MNQVTAIQPDTDALAQDAALVSGQYSEELGEQSADFLSFLLADELYAVPIKDIEEIRVWEKPTPIPRAPEFVCGVINIRGMIVPVTDLRRRFSLGECQYLPTTVVIVLREEGDQGERLMGIVVDAVSDVLAQDDKTLHPCVGDTAVTPYLVGLMNVGEQVMSLLDTHELLNMDKILRAK